MFNQEGGPQTHQSVLKISRNTGIRRSSVASTIFSQPPTGKQRAYIWLIMYPRVCVAT